MGAIVLLILGIIVTGLGFAAVLNAHQRPPRPRPLSNDEWFEQVRAGIDNPHADIATRTDWYGVAFGAAQFLFGILCIILAVKHHY